MNPSETPLHDQGKKSTETDTQVRYRSVAWSYLIMVILAAVFAAIRAIKNQPAMDLYTIVTAAFSAGYFYRAKHLKNRWDLANGVITLLIALLALYRFCRGY